jgi:hypothetical protein
MTRITPCFEFDLQNWPNGLSFSRSANSQTHKIKALLTAIRRARFFRATFPRLPRKVNDMDSIPSSANSRNRSFDVEDPNAPDPYRLAQEIWDSPEDARFMKFAKERPRDWGILVRLQILRSKQFDCDYLDEVDWMIHPQVGAANKGHAARILARAREVEIMYPDNMNFDVRPRRRDIFNPIKLQVVDQDERRKEETTHRPHEAKDDRYNEKRRSQRAEKRVAIESPTGAGDSMATQEKPVGDSKTGSPELTPEAKIESRSIVGDSTATPSRACDIDRIESIESNDSDINIDLRIDSIENGATPKLTVVVPADVVQAMVRMCKGALTAHRGRELLEKHGVERCRDVIESVPFWNPKNVVRMLERSLSDGPGKYPVHPKVAAARLAAEQEALNLLAVQNAATDKPTEAERTARPQSSLQPIDPLDVVNPATEIKAQLAAQRAARKAL